MNSASIAKLRLQKDSIEQKKLAELKEIAAELGLSNADVKHYGTLTVKATWLVAVNTKIAELFEESATNQHGDSGDRTLFEPEGDSTDTTITQEETIVKELEHLPFSAFQVPVPPTPLPFTDPDDEDEDEDEEEEDDDEDVYDYEVEDGDDEDEEATLKSVGPICADIILALPKFNYYQLTAFHYGVLLAHQDFQPVAYAIDSLGYSDRFSSEQSLSLKFQEFVPNTFERDGLIQDVKDLKASIEKPENCCQACDGLGNIFAGIADHLIDWETCDTCGGKGFLEPVPTLDDCPDCDGSGEVLDFSGEDSEPCPTCSTTEPTTEPKLSQPDVNVSVLVNFAASNFEHSRSVAAIAKSFHGACWCSGYLPDGYEEHWSFSSLSFANNFKEQCQAMPFVRSAKIDRIASNTPITITPPTDCYASDFEKETVIEFFKEEGSTPEELEEVRSQPMTKLDAAVVLGFAEHFKKSAEIALRLYLVDWVNDVQGERERCANRTDQLTVLLSWKYVSEAKAKLADHFQLRPGEVNCFITPDGWRVSVTDWVKEEILTRKEAEFLSPDDPVLELMGNGYIFALEKFKEQVSLSLVDLSPFPLTHESSSLA